MRLGRRINDSPYRLPNPDFLRPDPYVRIPYSYNKDIIGASTPEPTALRNFMPSRLVYHVFTNKRVLFCEVLDLEPHDLEKIVDAITRGGRAMTSDLSGASLVIC